MRRHFILGLLISWTALVQAGPAQELETIINEHWAWYLEQSPELRLPGIGFVALAIGLFVVSQRRSRVRQLIRHPQLTGVIVWAGAHLMMNGDSRSVTLFGILGVWAALEILLINRREGVWIKEASPPPSTDIVNLLITAVVIVVLVHLHPWFAGMPVFAG